MCQCESVLSWLETLLSCYFPTTFISLHSFSLRPITISDRSVRRWYDPEQFSFLLFNSGLGRLRAMSVFGVELLWSNGGPFWPGTSFLSLSSFFCVELTNEWINWSINWWYMRDGFNTRSNVVIFDRMLHSLYWYFFIWYFRDQLREFGIFEFREKYYFSYILLCVN